MGKTLPRNLWTWSICIENDLQEFQALIIDYENRNVLVTYEGDYCVLPVCLGGTEEYYSSFNVDFVFETISTLVGAELDLILLRQIWREEMDIEGEDKEIFTYEKAVVLLQCRHPTPFRNFEETELGGFEWRPLEDVDINHLFSDARNIIRSEMKMALQGVEPTKRVAWHRRGWLESASSWIENALTQKFNEIVVSTIDVLKTTELGIVLRIQTSRGSFYFKCTSTVANDAAYTLLLSQVIPLYVEKPTEVDLKRAWMISADYGTVLQPHMFLKEEKLHFTRDYVAMQCGTIESIKVLIGAGMPDFRPETLKSGLKRLFHHSSFLSLCNTSDSKEDMYYLQSNFRKLEGEIKKLQDSKIPSTVTHNDLFFSNVYKTPGIRNFRFFDWVDGYVGHPFTTHMSGLHEQEFVSEWISYLVQRNKVAEATSDLLRVGKRVRLGILLILSARDANRMEEPESSTSLAAFHETLRSLSNCMKRIK